MAHPLLTPQQRGRLLEIKEQSAIDAHFGQTADIYWSRTISMERLQRWLADDIESMILQMYDFKTATAPKALARIAAVIADADSQLASAAVSFAQSLGVAFQIIDDIHNFSRSPDWTKVAGEDLSGGKLTYVIATAIRWLADPARLRLQEILTTPSLRTDSKGHDEGMELVIHSGALEACRTQAKEMTEKAWSRFSPCLAASDAKIMLHAMSLKLLDLAYDG
jgi:geranylgeranyl pyrophosphate synthase